MERAIIVILFLLNVSFANAQTFDEWFRQKETQMKYLLEQIGALKAYGEVVNKGYDIAHNGLTNVFTSKEKDYQQHNNYFLSLWKVKSNVRNYSKVASAFKMKADIERQFRTVKFSSSEFLNDKERSYVNSVYVNLINGCNDLTDELEMVVNNDQLQLKDDERIERIDKIYLEIQDRYQFFQSFVNEIRLLVLDRLKEGNDVNKFYSLYGIK